MSKAMTDKSGKAGKPGKSFPPADPLAYAPCPARPLRAKARQLEQLASIQPHQHAWGQLLVSISGAVRVSAAQSTFIIPPSRAVWVPAGIVHQTSAIEQAQVRTLYALSELLAGEAWQRCRVMEVSPLLRELVMQLSTDPSTDPAAKPDTAREAMITPLIVDELRRARALRLGVELPQDARLRRLCEAMLEEPGRHASLEDWSAELGASARTVSRLFREHLGTSFAQWRSQVLLAHAVTLAARQRPMSFIAAELGYASASAFTAMVTRTVGMPPSRFFAEA